MKLNLRPILHGNHPPLPLRGPGGLLLANPLDEPAAQTTRPHPRSSANRGGSISHHLTTRSGAQTTHALSGSKAKALRKAMRAAEMAVWNSIPPFEREACR